MLRRCATFVPMHRGTPVVIDAFAGTEIASGTGRALTPLLPAGAEGRVLAASGHFPVATMTGGSEN
jgi:hypothetical protein